MADLTVCIPIGPAHQDLAARAIESVRGQSVPTNVLTWLDKDRRGPGYARNQMLTHVTTDFVTFLDADDWLDPDFAAATLALDPAQKYVFTDWWEESTPVTAPRMHVENGAISLPGRMPWCGGTWHIITTVLPTALVRQVGGFDETLAGMEDTDFYLKLSTSFFCGQHLPTPLVHYSLDGQRSKQLRSGPHYQATRELLSKRYSGKMGCCDGDGQAVLQANFDRTGLDLVRAVAAWGGNRKYVGRVTNTIYGRMGNFQVYEVDRRDALADQSNWRILAVTKVDDPVKLTSTADIAGILMGMVKVLPSTDATPPVEVRPDVDKVLRLAKRGQS